MPGQRNPYGMGRLMGLIDRRLFRSSIEEGRRGPASGPLLEKQLASEEALREQRQAAAAKERSLVLEARAKTLDSYAGFVQKVVPMAALAYGLSVSFSYFFLAIHFFPSGLSVGDTLLYVFIALGYGLLSFFFICAGLLVVLPVLAFDEGARHQGMRPAMAEGRGIWMIPPLISPFLLAAVGHLFAGGFGQEANEHAFEFVLVFLSVSFVIGVASHRRAWRLGAGGPDKWSAGWDSWMLHGLANGLVFQGLYGMLMLAHGQVVVVPVLVAVFAGMVAWFAMDMATSKENTPRGGGQGKAGTAVGSGSRDVPLSTGALVAGAGIAAGIAAGLFFAKEMQTAFYFALGGFVCWILLITSAPFPAKKKEEAVKEEAAKEDSQHGADQPPQTTGGDERKRLRGFLLPLAAAFTIPLGADLMYMDQKVSILVFSGLGFREENTTVRLKGEALASLRAQARNSGIELSVCTESDGSATISPVDVLWHGLGKRSLLSIGQVDNDGTKEGRGRPQVEVSSDEMKVLRNQGSHCRDVSRVVYFASGKVAPVLPQQAVEMTREVDSAFAALYPPARRFDNSSWVLNDVIVTGFADPMQLGEAGNEFLARERAACMAIELFDSIKKNRIQDFNLRWDGEGARSPFKTSCPLTGAHAALAECHAANRVVKVRLIFSCRGSDGKPSSKCQLAPEIPGAGDAASKPSTGSSNNGSGQTVDDRRFVRARASVDEAKKLCPVGLAVR